MEKLILVLWNPHTIRVKCITCRCQHRKAFRKLVGYGWMMYESIVEMSV